MDAEPNKKVKVHFKQQQQWLIISVIDQGPGIPEAIQEKVLQPFFTTKSNGTGLGLAVAKIIAETHGGEFSLKSKPNSGATVTFKLPIIEGSHSG